MVLPPSPEFSRRSRRQYRSPSQPRYYSNYHSPIATETYRKTHHLSPVNNRDSRHSFSSDNPHGYNNYQQTYRNNNHPSYTNLTPSYNNITPSYTSSYENNNSYSNNNKSHNDYVPSYNNKVNPGYNAKNIQVSPAGSRNNHSTVTISTSGGRSSSPYSVTNSSSSYSVGSNSNEPGSNYARHSTTTTTLLRVASTHDATQRVRVKCTTTSRRSEYSSRFVTVQQQQQQQNGPSVTGVGGLVGCLPALPPFRHRQHLASLSFPQKVDRPPDITGGGGASSLTVTGAVGCGPLLSSHESTYIQGPSYVQSQSYPVMPTTAGGGGSSNPLYARISPNASGASYVSVAQPLHKKASLRNGDVFKRSRTQTSYELSQDLLDKQIEVLERKYGGVKARTAALTIQRAFRRYTLLKKFADITAMAKAEKRISRRIPNSNNSELSPPPHGGGGSGDSSGANCGEQCEMRSYDNGHECGAPSSVTNTAGGTATANNNSLMRTLPMRSMSLRERRSAGMDNVGPPSHHHVMPRSHSGTTAVCWENFPYYAPGKDVPNTTLSTTCHQSPHHHHHHDSHSHNLTPGALRSSTMSSYGGDDGEPGLLGSRSRHSVSSASGGSGSGGSCSYGGGRKVPPEVPKRTSSISSRPGGGGDPVRSHHHHHRVSNGGNLTRNAENGSLSSVQSSGSDSSISADRINPPCDFMPPSTTPSSHPGGESSPVWKRKATPTTGGNPHPSAATNNNDSLSLSHHHHHNSNNPHGNDTAAAAASDSLLLHSSSGSGSGDHHCHHPLLETTTSLSNISTTSSTTSTYVVLDRSGSGGSGENLHHHHHHGNNQGASHQIGSHHHHNLGAVSVGAAVLATGAGDSMSGVVAAAGGDVAAGVGSAVGSSATGGSYKISETVRKRQYRVGLNLFNKKPDRGITYLIRRGFVENTPQGVARFLISRKGLSKQMIGEYLGNLQSPFCMAVLECFAMELDLAGMQVDVALRKFQQHFRMPGEAQKIERLMEVYSQRYCQCNGDVVARLRSPDSIFVLAFAIIMLNTDLHTPNIKPERRMRLEDFTKNLRGIDDCGDIDNDMLTGIYERVRDNEFKPGSDHVTQVMKVQATIVGKKPNMALPHRRLVCYCRLYEIPDTNKKERPGVHQREVFLFNDLLVITKIFSKKKSSVTYTFRNSFPLCGMVVTLFEKPHYPFGIHLSQRVDNKALVTFNARNEHDRCKFAEDLKESVSEMDEMENLRIEAELERQKSSRGNRAGTENRDSGVADVEVFTCQCPCAQGQGGGILAVGHQEGGGGLVVDVDNYDPQIKRSALSNSLLDIHEQFTGEKATHHHHHQQRRGSVGSLDSGMSVSFQSTSASTCSRTDKLLKTTASGKAAITSTSSPAAAAAAGSSSTYTSHNHHNSHSSSFLSGLFVKKSLQQQQQQHGGTTATTVATGSSSSGGNEVTTATAIASGSSVAKSTEV